MDDIKAKQQIVEKIKASTNILVTVSKNPSVDALSAAIGFTLLLDKLDKHATAIFSGTVPPAIAFLEPEKILDDTTDSLRDFIIALDKEKADHLRYKVEGDSVKIFITPYKTTITSGDLQFSQGDFNVELVIALGVDNQEHLDSALESHGQILHDAAVITVTSGDQTSNLGGVDWHDAQSSSLSEMVAGLAEAMKDDKNATLLDKQVATALLTGIVAETDRFSNTHTTARAMTIASQLMAGGADQQLIASKLAETQEIGQLAIKNDGESLTIPKVEPAKEAKESLTISHKPDETLEELDKRVKAAEQAEAATVAGEALQSQVESHGDNSIPGGAYAPQEAPLGGDESEHSYMATTPSFESSMNANETPASGGYVLDSELEPASSEPTEAAHQELIPPTPPTPADLGLLMPPPLPPSSATVSPDVLPVYAVDPGETSQPERLGDILAPEPSSSITLPPPAVTQSEPALPVYADPIAAPSALPPMTTITPEPAPASPSPNDPGQFKIPGQP